MLGPTEVSKLLTNPVEHVAPALLGATFTANDVSVRLVEVEAYAGVGADPASHAHRGPTPRNTPMFGAAGTLYMYFTYGMHWCANITCGPIGAASAVLLRAGEVIAGMELARARTKSKLSDHQLGQGPARLARILNLSAVANASHVLDGPGPATLVLCEGPQTPISVGPRVGVSSAASRPWRFWCTNSLAVSKYRRHRGAVD